MVSLFFFPYSRSYLLIVTNCPTTPLLLHNFTKTKPKIRAIYSYEITVLTLVSTLLVAWAVLTYAMERFNVYIPWANILVSIGIERR